MKIPAVLIPIVFTLLPLCIGCSENSSQKTQPSFAKPFEEMRNLAVGKKVTFVDSIFNKVDGRILPRIILVYSGMDCGSCVSKGFGIIKKLRNLNKDLPISTVSISSNRGNDQILNNYHNYIYDDSKDLIRRELNFIYTPCIIILNHQKIINEIIFINSQSIDVNSIINQINFSL